MKHFIACALIAVVLQSAASGPVAAAGKFAAWGVDFGNRSYAKTPCNGTPATMHDGRYTYSEQVAVTSIDASIQQVTPGNVSGSKLASVVWQCAPPKGCYNEVSLYSVSTGTPALMAKLGSLYDGCPDPDEWFRVRFTPKFVYADVRNQGNNWTVTTYALRGGKLAAVFVKHHKR